MRRVTVYLESVLLATLLSGAVQSQPVMSGTGDWIPAVADQGLPGDLVVAEGESVTLDGVQDLHEIRVESGGELILSDVQLSVETILILPGGSARVSGDSHVVFEDAPIDLTRDPDEMGHGWVSYGTTIVQGEPKTTFQRLAEAPRAGDTAFIFAQPVEGWEPGDELVIGDSRGVHRQDIYKSTFKVYGVRLLVEHPVVQSVSADGLTVTLTEPLEYDHPGSPEGSFLPHVANKTRSITFRSENADGVRGHFLCHGPADVRYAAFESMGRTENGSIDLNEVDETGTVVRDGANQLGRYSLHAHHATAPQFVGNSVTNALRWGITIHGTTDGLIKDNVVWYANGSCVMLENGTEFNNRFENNFVGRAITGTGGAVYAGQGVNGNGYWLDDTENHFIDNVAVNCLNGFGGFPGPESFAAEFSGNEYYGVQANDGHSGALNVSSIGMTRASGGVEDDATRGTWVIDGFTAWNFSNIGIKWHRTWNTRIENAILIGPGHSSRSLETRGINFFRPHIKCEVVNPTITNVDFGINGLSITGWDGNTSPAAGLFRLEGGFVEGLTAALNVDYAYDNESESDASARRIEVDGTQLASRRWLIRYDERNVREDPVTPKQEFIWTRPDGEVWHIYYRGQKPGGAVEKDQIAGLVVVGDGTSEPPPPEEPPPEDEPPTREEEWQTFLADLDLASTVLRLVMDADVSGETAITVSPDLLPTQQSRDLVVGMADFLGLSISIQTSSQRLRLEW